MSRKNTRWMNLRTWMEKRTKTKSGNALQEELEQIRTRLKKYDQCESLQDRVLLFCDMTGAKYENMGNWLRFWTPTGKNVTIYRSPLVQLSLKSVVYGFIDDPSKRWGRIRYIDEPVALHMYEFLGKKIKELENKNQ